MKSIHKLIAIIGSGKIKVALQIPIIKLRWIFWEFHKPKHAINAIISVIGVVIIATIVEFNKSFEKALLLNK